VIKTKKKRALKELTGKKRGVWLPREANRSPTLLIIRKKKGTREKISESKSPGGSASFEKDFRESRMI